METELTNFAHLPNFIDETTPGKMFSKEDQVPPLPVPDLDQTLDLYLDSAIVHLSPSEYRQTLIIVEEFRRGVGRKLHNKLLERASRNRNWLEAWWEEFAYLRTRTPLSPGANMCGPGPYYCHYWPPREGSQLFRAAVIVHLMTEFRQFIRHERFPIDKRADGAPLSMSQYKRIFNGCRIPGTECDALTYHFRTKKECVNDDNSYVVVICNGRLFRLEVYDNASAEQKNIPELHLQLQRIEAMSRQKGIGLPLLTALGRTSWAKARQHLMALHPVNVSLLQVIEKAAACLTLDQTCPSTPDEILESFLRSGEGMTWADKSYGILSFRNGIIGVSCDHAQMDGIALMASSFYYDIQVFKNKGYPTLEEERVSQPSLLEPPTELVFVVDDFIRDQIEVSHSAYKEACENIEARLPRFRAWGRRQMKLFSVHPDTAVQLSLQLAYYRLHEKPAPTYETSTTRRFWRGRTETLRSCTPEAINWCRVMLEPGCSTAERKRLFSLAYTKHNELRKACESGRGCDRHLLGLACIAMGEGIEMPEIFTDPAWERSGGNGYFSLSTSTLGYTSVIGCVSAMHKDGYGCFYRIGVDLVEMVVTTFKSSSETNCSKMVEAIDSSMSDILHLLQTASSVIKNNSKL